MATAPTHTEITALERTYDHAELSLHAAVGRRSTACLIPPVRKYLDRWVLIYENTTVFTVPNIGVLLILQFNVYLFCVRTSLGGRIFDRERTPTAFCLCPLLWGCVPCPVSSFGNPSSGRVCRALHRAHAAALHTARRHATVRGFLHPGWLFTGRKAADLPGVWCVACRPCSLSTNTTTPNQRALFMACERVPWHIIPAGPRPLPLSGPRQRYREKRSTMVPPVWRERAALRGVSCSARTVYLSFDTKCIVAYPSSPGCPVWRLVSIFF